MVSSSYSIYLGVALVWTIFFSMFNRQPLRGNRNLGLLACYVIFVVMLFRLPFAVALTTWAAFGIAGGVCYIAYEIVSRLRTPAGEDKAEVRFGNLLQGLYLWPVMIPEAIEYLAADFRLLPAPVLPVVAEGVAPEAEVKSEEEV